MNTQPENYLTSVRNQYEELPYPPRNPQDEYKFMQWVHTDNLGCLNHYCYGGTKIYDDNFKVLVAGGGTGDSTIYMAEMLRDTGAKVIQVDLSTASLAIAKERAKIRKLDNIEFIHGSLLDVEQMGIGPFDYINCSGVLHHLKDPDAGLKALANVLKDDGAMGIMVYGYYGRHGLYMIQNALKLLNRNTDDTEEKLDTTKRLLEILPKEHPFHTSDTLFLDHINLGESGIYDMFLHSQDRAYTVDETYDFVERSGLYLRHLFKQQDTSPILYTPEIMTTDAKLLGLLEGMTNRQKESLGELMHGKTAKQIFYATKQEGKALQADNLQYIPYFSEKAYNMRDVGFDGFLKSVSENNDSIDINIQSISFSFKRNPLTKLALGIINDERNIADIGNGVAIAAQKMGIPNIEPMDGVHELQRIMKFLEPLDWILLRHQSVPKPPTSISAQIKFMEQNKGRK